MINIFRGDSTAFANVDKFLNFTIKTELDLMGWKAIFTLGAVTKTIEDISSKTFDVTLTQEDTSKLWWGDCCGCIKLIDAKGNIKTVANNIPFNVTNQVIENEYENINLNIPNCCELDLELTVGFPYDNSSVTSVNGQTGDVVLEIPSIEGLATKQELDTKQPKGDTANVSNIPTLISQLQNDLGYQTLADVMGIIASIPQFKLSIVNDLPTIGEKMTLYLVPKEESANDVYNEYIWIEQTSSFELIGTTAVDLTDYVKNTDYATGTKGGVVKVGKGLQMSAGEITISKASTEQISAKSNNYYPIVPSNLNYAVNSVLPTMTQAEYDALGTKDENLFYMIVEG